MTSKTNYIKWALAGIGVIAVVALIGNAMTKKDIPIEEPETPPTYPNIASSTLEPMNSKDYSTMSPGTTFHDDYWHGTVTIVGKQGEIEYQQMVKDAGDRLIAEQDGMVIYVEKDKDYVPQSDYSAVQSGEDETPISEEDKAFYSKPSVQLEGQSNLPSGSRERLFPGCGWSGLRYAVKEFLTNIGLEDISTITIVPNSVQFSGTQRGFQCTLDDVENEEIGVYFDITMGMWQFSSSELNDGNSYISYNPVDFVAPSAREAAAEELNGLVGYAKF